MKCILLLFCLVFPPLSSSSSLIPHTQRSNVLREKGDARLEDYQSKMFMKYTNYTYNAYAEAFLKGNKKGWQQIGFTCLNPHAKVYGGMGNLLLSMLGMQFFSVAINRAPVINHALLKDMFEHPDPRQNLAPLSNALVNKDMKHSIKGYAARTLATRDKSIFKNVKFIGSHGAPAAACGFKAFAPQVSHFIPRGMALNEDEFKFYDNIMCQGFAAWLMSRPTKRLHEAALKYKDNFINKCDAQNIPDIAIQIRTLDNIKSEFGSSMEDCYVSCAVAKAREVQKQLQRDICIFVTSNRVKTTDNVVEALNSILNTEDLSAFKFLYHQFKPNSTIEIMHSGKLVEAGRYIENFPPSHDFSLKDDLMDWFLLGEAVHVIGSRGSTFLSTARLRIGNSERHIFHPLQNDVAPVMSVKTNYKCECETYTKMCT